MPAQYADDPILQRIRARALADLRAERAPLLSERKQLLLELGDPRIARSIFGKGKLKKGERAFVKSVRLNPFSALDRIGHETRLARGRLNEGLNEQGGFYTGYRLDQLGELDRARQLQVTDVTRGTRRGLTDIVGNLARLRRDYNRQILAAEEAAHQRNLLNF